MMVGTLEVLGKHCHSWLNLCGCTLTCIAFMRGDAKAERKHGSFMEHNYNCLFNY